MKTREEHVALGNLTARRHPTEPLTIFNYTDRVAFDDLWDETLLQCRGLIVHDDGTIVARPFRKFFNLGQTIAADPDAGNLPAQFKVFDKADGSLGISYREPSTGRIAISTRGSMTSEQALHATALWREKYEGLVNIPRAETWLFEIIYPENKIVLDYKGMDDLLLLGRVNIATGADRGLPEFPCADLQHVPSFGMNVQPEDLPVRDNAEGYVLVESPLPLNRPARRAKVKLPEYVRLHKLLAGLTAHRIWECLAAGDAIESILDGVPDETFKDAQACAERFREQHDEIEMDAAEDLIEIRDRIGADASRKAFAEKIKNIPTPRRSIVFLMLSGAPTSDAIWKILEPRGDEPMRLKEPTKTEMQP